MTLKIRTISTVLLFGIFALSVCQSTAEIGTEVSVEGNPYRIVNVSELQSMLENKDFVMVNVHTP